MIIGQNSNGETHIGKVVQEFYLDKLSDRLMIIPAAGLGTRVGSPPAKELLPHPKEEGTFIEVALRKARKFNSTPLVISRFDKNVLNNWLLENKIPHILVTKTSEWVETVILSKRYWKDKNLLLLPDTDFSPKEIISDLFLELDSKPLAFGVFDVENISLWGSLKSEQERRYISEKNRNHLPGKAWGLISFTKKGGDVFWPLYLESQLLKDWVEIPIEFSELHLLGFTDLTR